MKTILILHTGGTIAMQEDKNTGEVTPDLTNPLLNLALTENQQQILITEDFANLPSPHITPEIMLALKKRIEQACASGVDSVVITHGTDTLEETAYFLDVTIGQQIPIVVTGAMRSSNEIGSDGFYNFQCALRVAADDAAIGKGVLVVMNDEIHSARYVTKTHTSNVATFRTPTFGPLGIITKHKIQFTQVLTPHTHVNVDTVSGRIPIIKAYAGMDHYFLELLSAEDTIDGLVVEALGAGNLPPQTLPALTKILQKKIPIVLVSRCFNGFAEGIYAYPGGGITLQNMGILFCNGLNSQKARLKLLVALNAQLEPRELADFLAE